MTTAANGPAAADNVASGTLDRAAQALPGALKDRALVMVGNAHIDPVWLWHWQEGLQEVKATFRSALDRMNEYPDFVFTASSAAFYEFVERSDPAMFGEIQRRVAEGRWELAGGWWVEPDCNVPSGESFVRQALYGQRYFLEKFGRAATVGYNPDAFGHNAMLPQILAKSGLDSYVFMRPQSHEKDLPAPLFWWEAPDGSRVLAFRILYEYTVSGRDIEPHVRRCAAALGAPGDELLCMYGVGNHGGGPTKENLEQILAMDEDPAFPRVRPGSAKEFFSRARARHCEIPVVRDELQYHAKGCYAATSAVKRWNRRAENALLAAEKLSAIAARSGALPYPTEFRRAWTDVLFDQFHDILAGTAIEPAYEDARDTFGEATAIAARALNDAAQSLSWRVGIPFREGTKPIVVLNPHAWQARVPVELESGGVRDGDVLLDDEDRPLPLQEVRSHATVNTWRKRLTFVADLPAMGYRVYRTSPAAGGSAMADPVDAAASASPEADRVRSAFAPAAANDLGVETARFRLRVDERTGGIATLYDKRAGVEVFAGVGARAMVIADPTDTWGHGVRGFRDVVGEFARTSSRLIEHGPVKSVISVHGSYGASLLRQDLIVYPGLDRIDVEVTVDWRERHKALKLRFPCALASPRATYEIPYGHLERAGSGDEEPGQGWIDVTGIPLAAASDDRGGVTAQRPSRGARYGLSILNDGVYSFDVDRADAAMTVLRSPIYAHHDPFVPDADDRYSYTDQGIHRFTYALLPHEGDWRHAQTARRAAELNQRPVALFETYHDGPLPLRASYLSARPGNVIVSVLKRAEDSDDLVLRCHETAGVATSATIDMPAWDRHIDVHLGPSEIATLLVPADSALPVRAADLLERAL
ncbi:MAG: alpha-mannosidase [Candidatus Limnocylindria bacterium]